MIKTINKKILAVMLVLLMGLFALVLTGPTYAATNTFEYRTEDESGWGDWFDTNSYNLSIYMEDDSISVDFTDLGKGEYSLKTIDIRSMISVEYRTEDESGWGDWFDTNSYNLSIYIEEGSLSIKRISIAFGER